MKARLYVALAALLALLLSTAVQAGPESSLLKELGLKEYPGSKRLTEINLPSCKLLDNITKEFGPQLGLSDVKQASIVTFRVDPSADSQVVYRHFEPGIMAQGWKAMVRSFEGEDGMAVLYHEKIGMLVVNIDAPGGRDRQLTIVRVIGKIDLGKTASNNPNLSSRIRQWMGGGYGPEAKGIGPNFAVSKLPTGQPISIPPSEWLHIRSTGSSIRARFADQNTTEIRVQAKNGDPGELVRTDEGLILFIAPGTPVQDMVLPSNVHKIIQITEGSMVIQGGRPGLLTIASTSAPITLDSVAMISGGINIKAVGADVALALQELQGGKLDADVTGSNLTLTLPRNASARIVIDAPTARIRNATDAQPRTTGDRTNLVYGGGGALVHLQVVKGTVTVGYGR